MSPSAKKNRYKLVILLLLFLATAGLGYSYLLIYTPTLPGAPNKNLEIRRGMGINQVSNLLKEQGIIKCPFLFTSWARLTGRGQRIKAGEYSLSASLAPVDILVILEEGKTLLHKVTIPEGYSIKQIAEVLEIEGLVDKDEFITIAHDPGLIERWNIPNDSLEGYLFPDTYHFTKRVGAKKILTTMLKQFEHNLPDQWRKRATGIGFTLHQIVTLASLIEKEVGVNSERPIISAVYHNRLKADIRLQCDPTVIYAIPNFDGNLTKEHLRQLDSPYNTYRYSGLPPGPIANPGRASIRAALYPDDVSFLYFVSRNDGTHQFSNTLRQHNRAVLKYQKRRSGRSPGARNRR
jgi:UPF0755 protein